MSMGLPNPPNRSKHAGGNHPTHTTPQGGKGGKGGNHQSPHPNHTTPQGGGKQPTPEPHHTAGRGEATHNDTTPHHRGGKETTQNHTTPQGAGGGAAEPGSYIYIYMYIYIYLCVCLLDVESLPNDCKPCYVAELFHRTFIDWNKVWYVVATVLTTTTSIGPHTCWSKRA